MGSWQTVPIKSVYHGLYDGPHATPALCAEGPVFLGIKNVTDDGALDLTEIRHISEGEFPRWTKRVNPQPGDIVFTYEATLNRYAIVPDGFRGCLGRRMALIRTNPAKIDPRFLHFYFFSKQWREVISNNTLTGATVDRIPLTKFPDFPITIPDLPTQRKIAGILSAYDDLIENNLRRIKILEEMAQSLYREWFVRFRFPGHESTRFIDSPLGQIPEGWEAGRLEDVLVLQRGFDLPKAEREVGDVPIYAASGITGHHSESKVKGPGIVTGRSGTIGQVVYVHEDFWPLNTALWVKAFPKSEPLYAYYVLAGIDLKGFNSGAAVPTLNRNDVHGLGALIPPIALQRRFQELADTMLNQSRTLTISNQIIRRTRDLVLPKLISASSHLINSQ